MFFCGRWIALLLLLLLKWSLLQFSHILPFLLCAMKINLHVCIESMGTHNGLVLSRKRVEIRCQVRRRGRGQGWFLGKGRSNLCGYGDTFITSLCMRLRCFFFFFLKKKDRRYKLNQPGTVENYVTPHPASILLFCFCFCFYPDRSTSMGHK